MLKVIMIKIKGSIFSFFSRILLEKFYEKMN
ncbi:Hypothetical protein Minf_0078 [Methylacidiphilum infernorum V4]|uniref:Uncharacterized protein n=1 Tax=Methylacidiphilum infernorum (isolate V4) TaxID=481448 RepID=B3DWZ8_METI4|nr:Hypothetical protein Minf_0078 [Methylacidiphilum infernorum V4]